MTGEEVYNAIVGFFTSYLVPGHRMFTAIRDVLPGYIDPKKAETLQQALERPKEQGVCDIFSEALGEFEKFGMFVDLLRIKMLNEKAPETKPPKDAPGA